MHESHPLTDEHAAALQRVIERSHQLVQLLKKCDGCDMDVSEPLATIQAQLDKVSKYKANFFPHLS